MKKTVSIIIVLITILMLCGCTYQNHTVASSETVVQEAGKTSAPTPPITPAPVTSPTSPIVSVTPDAEASFTLTKEDFEKLNASLTVLALTNAYSPELNYDLKNGLSKDSIYHYAYRIVDYFDYFYPTSGYSKLYERDNERYGIKKGDLHFDSKGTHIPQKGINSILLSTFGKQALNGIDMNENVFDDGYANLKDGIYIIGPSDPPAIDDIVLGPLDLPLKATSNTQFTTSFSITYTAVPPVIDNFSVTFKLKKDDTSEWGYNITAFNMQKVE